MPGTAEHRAARGEAGAGYGAAGTTAEYGTADYGTTAGECSNCCRGSGRACLLRLLLASARDPQAYCGCLPCVLSAAICMACWHPFDVRNFCLRALSV